MKLKDKFLRFAVCAALILAVIPGCSSDDADTAVTESQISNVTTAETTVAPVTEMSEEDIEKIKEVYKLSDDEAAEYADEKTSLPIIFSGFNSHYFPTPAKKSDIPVTVVTSILSHSGMHSYIEENSENYVLDQGENSFAEFVEKYDDSYFNDKGILVISFLDQSGGSDYSVTGGWDVVDSGEGYHLQRMVFSVKKSAGESTAGHMIVEIDTKFMSLWDAFGIEIYE